MHFCIDCTQCTNTQYHYCDFTYYFRDRMQFQVVKLDSDFVLETSVFHLIVPPSECCCCVCLVCEFLCLVFSASMLWHWCRLKCLYSFAIVLQKECEESSRFSSTNVYFQFFRGSPFSQFLFIFEIEFNSFQSNCL